MQFNEEFLLEEGDYLSNLDFKTFIGILKKKLKITWYGTTL